MIDDTTPPVGVIGGSGFYEFVEEARAVDVTTPFGPPSEPPVVGFVDGTPVAFIPRHGRDHRFAPHRVPYRANMWALRSVGVRQVLAPCAVGSLQPDVGPGPPRRARSGRRPHGWSRRHVLRRARAGGARRVRRPVLPDRPRNRARGGRRTRAGRRSTAARWWWCLGRGSRRAPSRIITRPRAGPLSA